MYFDDLSNIREIAGNYGTTVFVLPNDVDAKIDGALYLEPIDTATISIEQVRDVIARFELKQFNKQFVFVRPAEALGTVAANALLKTLEEPGNNVHFVLVTSEPSRLLPTILSRAAVFYYRRKDDLTARPKADVRKIDLAKKLIVASGDELAQIADEFAGKKDGARMFALETLGVAIEILYKSYFITKKPIFLKKLPHFLTLYDAILNNGHLKLHVVADLI